MSLGGPTKVKAGMYFLFTEDSLRVEIKNTFFDFIVTLYYHFAQLFYLQGAEQVTRGGAPMMRGLRMTYI